MKIKAGRVRVYFRKNFMNKDHPFWFARRWPGGGATFQSMWLNVHIFKKV